MSNESLRNATYSEDYRQGCIIFQPLFSEENRAESETITLPDGYSILKTGYKGEVNGRNLSGNRCVLSDGMGNVVHRWNNFDDDAEFHTLIHHRNGNKYLVYRQEVYGYTVFDLTNGKEFQYYPRCVLDGREYFIWTGIHYNPQNNIVAVSGCIWGAPWSTLIVDFENPMTEPGFQSDAIDLLDGGYDVYDDADFVRWDDDMNLILNCYNIEKNQNEEVVVKPDAYLSFAAK